MVGWEGRIAGGSDGPRTGPRSRCRVVGLVLVVDVVEGRLVEVRRARSFGVGLGVSEAQVLVSLVVMGDLRYLPGQMLREERVLACLADRTVVLSLDGLMAVVAHLRRVIRRHMVVVAFAVALERSSSIGTRERSGMRCWIVPPG